MTRALTVLAALLAAVLAVVCGVTVQAAATTGITAGTGSGGSWCQQYGAVRTGWYVIRDDYWYGQVCLSARAAGFTITRTVFPASRYPVYAFPNIFAGCEYGWCSRHSGMPARVSALGDPRVTFQTTGHGRRGGWNAAVEAWFSRHQMTTGHADQAELMVWLRAPGWADSRKVVHVGGRAYFLAHWVDPPGHAGPGTPGWQYIQFKLVRPVRGVTGLALMPFIRYAVRHGWIKPWSWMENVEGGFELRAAARLAVTRFSVTNMRRQNAEAFVHSRGTRLDLGPGSGVR